MSGSFAELALKPLREDCHGEECFFRSLLE
jgi:hypothetical protein